MQNKNSAPINVSNETELKKNIKSLISECETIKIKTNKVQF